jgi:hypothetical protein
MTNQDKIRKILREEFIVEKKFGDSNRASRKQEKLKTTPNSDYKDIQTDKPTQSDIDKGGDIYKRLRDKYNDFIKVGSFTGLLRQLGVLGVDEENDSVLSAYRKAVLNLGSDGKESNPTYLSKQMAQEMLNAMESAKI